MCCYSLPASLSDVSLWDTPAMQSEVALQGEYVCLSKQVMGIVRMLLSAPPLRQVTIWDCLQQGWSICTGALAVGTSLLSQAKLQLVWTWAKLIANTLPATVGCPILGNRRGALSFLHALCWSGITTSVAAAACYCFGHSQLFCHFSIKWKYKLMTARKEVLKCWGLILNFSTVP